MKNRYSLILFVFLFALIIVSVLFAFLNSTKVTIETDDLAKQLETIKQGLPINNKCNEAQLIYENANKELFNDNIPYLLTEGSRIDASIRVLFDDIYIADLPSGLSFSKESMKIQGSLSSPSPIKHFDIVLTEMNKNCVRHFRLFLGVLPKNYTNPLLDQYNLVEVFGGKGKNLGAFNLPYGSEIITHRNKDYILLTDCILHLIYIFDLKGNLVRYFGGPGTEPGTLNTPADIQYNSRTEEIIVSEERNHRLQVFSFDGTSKRTVTSLRNIGNKKMPLYPLHYPLGIAIDNHGRVFTATSSDSKIKVFNNDFNFLYEFSKHGSQLGEFSSPYYLEISKNGEILYVVDRGNHRVQSIHVYGAPIKQVGNMNDLAIPDQEVILAI